ncbi:MAG TPA: hypothetical protein VFW75_04635 [Acetobacteraceae bacterium]|nr:hypothetical protein [Acetobacteraceae bacterium]
MSDLPQEAIQAFLEQLGALLNQSVPTPDFDDLYDIDPTAGAGGVIRATPDDIEAFVVMGLQQAEIARQQAAEEARVAAQWDIAGSVKTRNDTVPEQPASAALEILGASDADKLPGLIDTAEKAYQALSAARGGPDDAFETATADALSALDTRDAAIAALHTAISDKIAERNQTIGGLNDKFADLKGTMMPEAGKLLQTGKQKSVKTLNTALAGIGSSIAELDPIVASAAPADFDQRVLGVNRSLDVLPQQIGNVNQLATSLRTNERAGQIADLRLTLRAIAPTDFALLPADIVSKPLTEKSAEFQRLHAALRQLAPTASAEAFAQAIRETGAARDDAEQAHVAATNAIAAELKRRGEETKRLDDKRNGVAAPKLLAGTAEASDYAGAENTVRAAFTTLKQLAVTGPPSGFADAAKTADQALNRLSKAGIEAREKARARAETLKALRAELNAVGQGILDEIKALDGSPVPGIGKVANDAFRKESAAAAKRIDSKDPQADQAEAATFKAFAAKTSDLIKALAKIDTASFNPVSGSVVIVGGVDAVKKQLTSIGIGDAAINLATELDKDVGKVSDRYRDIANLRTRYDDVTKDKSIAPQSQRQLQGFPAFEAAKDTHDKGGLTRNTNQFLKPVIVIEKLIRAAAEDAEYLASPVYAYIQLVDNNTDNPITALEALVHAGTASRGDITDAYRSSYDRPDRFSVEVAVPIDGRNGVVVHAHCQVDGTPQAGNGCHVKLWKDRFDPGGFQLSNSLRGSLLPPTADNAAKARAKQLIA